MMNSNHILLGDQLDDRKTFTWSTLAKNFRDARSVCGSQTFVFSSRSFWRRRLIFSISACMRVLVHVWHNVLHSRHVVSITIITSSSSSNSNSTRFGSQRPVRYGTAFANNGWLIALNWPLQSRHYASSARVLHRSLSHLQSTLVFGARSVPPAGHDMFHEITRQGKDAPGRRKKQNRNYPTKYTLCIMRWLQLRRLRLYYSISIRRPTTVERPSNRSRTIYSSATS